MVFIPTYLYIKQHTITGKLYFGKTIKSESKMIQYKGSGLHWKKHYKKHGRDHVVTLWYQLYDNVFDLVADAMSMSKSLDIVNSKSWLNMQIENGLDSISLSAIMKVKNPMHLDYVREIKSNQAKGDKNPFYGKKHTIESRLKIRYKAKFHDFKCPDGTIILKITNKELSELFNLSYEMIKKTLTKGKTYRGFSRVNTHA